MKLHSLKPQEGSVKNRKRVGRGQGSGHGTTAGRGNKGQKSRTGHSRKVGFEGGQTPLQTRVPKRGFKNIFRKSYKVFNLGQIDAIIDKYELKEVSWETLYENSLIQKTDLVKILGNGELTKKVDFKVNAISKTAKSAIEELGGSIEIL